MPAIERLPLDRHRLAPAMLVAALALLGSGAFGRASAQEWLSTAQHAVVQVWAVDDSGAIIGSGSGSIIAPTGLILTNFHVVGDHDTGQLYNEGGVSIICMVKDARDPCVVVADAVYVKGDPDRDLALVQIVADVDGNAIDPSQLNLPSLRLGDSSTLKLGDELAILGFPAIGEGEGRDDEPGSITYTPGRVSGFIKGRGNSIVEWIKTTAQVGRGNSGGAALNAAGQLVAVPSATFDIQDGGLHEKMGLLRPANALPVAWFTGSSPSSTPSSAPSSPASRSPSASREPRSAGVTFSGQIVDANTGRGVSGAGFLLIKPAWVPGTELTEDDVVGVAQTDAQGFFRTQPAVPRGITYPVVVVADGYRELDSQFTLPTDAPAVVELETIRLQH